MQKRRNSTNDNAISTRSGVPWHMYTGYVHSNLHASNDHFRLIHSHSLYLICCITQYFYLPVRVLSPVRVAYQRPIKKTSTQPLGHRFHLRHHGPLTDQCSVKFDVSTPIGSVYRWTICHSPMFSSHARIIRQPAARKPLDAQELEVFTLPYSCPARDSHLYREPQGNHPGCRSLLRTCLSSPYYSCNGRKSSPTSMNYAFTLHLNEYKTSK